MDIIIGWLKGLILAMAAVIIPALGTLAGQLIIAKIKEIKNPLVKEGAMKAVLAMEDKYGPDSGNGAQKFAAASAWLAKEFKIPQEQAQLDIRAAYTNFVNTAKYPINAPTALQTGGETCVNG